MGCKVALRKLHVEDLLQTVGKCLLIGQAAQLLSLVGERFELIARILRFAAVSLDGFQQRFGAAVVEKGP